jgi:hypothetical protein
MMDENDRLLTLFPTHQVTILFHNSEIDCEKELMEYMQHALAVGLTLGLKPMASFYTAIPPFQVDAEGIENAIEEWSGVDPS